MGFSLQTPVAGQPDATEDPKLAGDMTTLQNWGNGNIDPADVKAAFAQSAGMNQAGQTVKGAVNIATSQSTGSTTYTTLGTPDQVTGIVLPTNGLIVVWYQATWQESVAAAGQATICLNATPVVMASTTAASPVVTSQSVQDSGTVNTNKPLSSGPFGLQSGSPNATAYAGDVTTGQLVGVTGASNAGGGPAYIFAATGTYTVSVQFKASSGTVTASNRKLWVQALSFA